MSSSTSAKCWVLNLISSGNVGSGTVEELAKWVEYMTSEGDSPMARLRRQNGRDKAWKVKYLGVGNESWGSRAGSMRPEYCADLYRRYSTYCHLSTTATTCLRLPVVPAITIITGLKS